jgi:hypothetical protein
MTWHYVRSIYIQIEGLILKLVELSTIPTYFSQIDSEPMAVGHEPLLRPLGIAAEALHGKPEFCRVIRNNQMNRLVRDQISKNGVWRHNHAPVERQVSLRGAVSPLCSLSHNIDPARALS